jgi:hypothetical protein
MVSFAKHMEEVFEHFDDVLVELNDELGNITTESEDNLLEITHHWDSNLIFVISQRKQKEV